MIAPVTMSIAHAKRIIPAIPAAVLLAVWNPEVWSAKLVRNTAALTPSQVRVVRSQYDIFPDTSSCLLNVTQVDVRREEALLWQPP